MLTKALAPRNRHTSCWWPAHEDMHVRHARNAQNGAQTWTRTDPLLASTGPSSPFGLPLPSPAADPPSLPWPSLSRGPPPTPGDLAEGSLKELTNAHTEGPVLHREEPAERSRA